VRDKLRHPFWQAALLIVLAYLLFKFGIAYLPGLIGMKSAPVPSSVVLQYMAVVIVAILIYVSSDERRWTGFKAPIHAVLVDNDKKILRTILLVAIPCCSASSLSIA
jgi:1,4-dihydroxy-2-naphthoate octaprenyltransferase